MGIQRFKVSRDVHQGEAIYMDDFMGEMQPSYITCEYTVGPEAQPALPFMPSMTALEADRALEDYQMMD
jgi:hypothetical protein